jgi:hypothetical protein
MQPSSERRIVKLLPRDYVDSRLLGDGRMTPAGCLSMEMSFLSML